MIAGNTASFESSWQQPSYASMRFKRLDSQSPLVLVDYELEELNQAYRLTLQGDTPGLLRSYGVSRYDLDTRHREKQ